jgi:predicted nucleic acid-binding protein
VALIVLDAGVAIAHLDGGDPHHEAVQKALRECVDDDVRLPASALSEALVGPARKGRLLAAKQDLEAILTRIEPVGESVAERAAELRARHPALRLPDALVLACGDVLDAEAVLTTDRRWRRLPRVRVVT